MKVSVAADIEANVEATPVDGGALSAPGPCIAVSALVRVGSEARIEPVLGSELVGGSAGPALPPSATARDSPPPTTPSSLGSSTTGDGVTVTATSTPTPRLIPMTCTVSVTGTTVLILNPPTPLVIVAVTPCASCTCAGPVISVAVNSTVLVLVIVIVLVVFAQTSIDVIQWLNPGPQMSTSTVAGGKGAPGVKERHGARR